MPVKRPTLGWPHGVYLNLSYPENGVLGPKLSGTYILAVAVNVITSKPDDASSSTITGNYRANRELSCPFYVLCPPSTIERCSDANGAVKLGTRRVRVSLAIERHGRGTSE